MNKTQFLLKLLILLLITCATSLLPKQSWAQEGEKSSHSAINLQVIVSGRPSEIDQLVEVTSKSLSLVELSRLDLSIKETQMRVYQSDIKNDKAVALLNEVADQQDLKSLIVEANRQTQASSGIMFGSPGGPPLQGPSQGFENQWAFGSRGVSLWTDPPRGITPDDLLLTGQDVVVGIFDTCPDVLPTLWIDNNPSYPVQAQPASLGNYKEHGSGIASIIAHIAPSASIELYCVLGADGLGDVSNLIAALDDFLARHQNSPLKKVVNLSLKIIFDDQDPTQIAMQGGLKFIVDAMAGQGFVVFAAAGNGYGQQEDYPASLPNVLGVASSNYDHGQSISSNFGSISAPGGDLLYLPQNFPQDKDRFCGLHLEFFIMTRASAGGNLCWTGSSFATPFAVGEAALLLDSRMQLTQQSLSLLAQNIFDLMQSSADPFAIPGNGLGSGIINIDEWLVQRNAQ